MLFPVCILEVDGEQFGVSPLAPGLRFKVHTTAELKDDVLAAWGSMRLHECDDAQRVIEDHRMLPEYASGSWHGVDVGEAALPADDGEPIKLNISMRSGLRERIKKAVKSSGHSNMSAYCREAILAKLSRGK
jgi:hypothetical protein